jgi:hypothetical protein
VANARAYFAKNIAKCNKKILSALKLEHIHKLVANAAAYFAKQLPK